MRRYSLLKLKQNSLRLMKKSQLRLVCKGVLGAGSGSIFTFSGELTANPAIKIAHHQALLHNPRALLLYSSIRLSAIGGAEPDSTNPAETAAPDSTFRPLTSAFGT
jgi:hypothetical protein